MEMAPALSWSMARRSELVEVRPSVVPEEETERTEGEKEEEERSGSAMEREPEEVREELDSSS